METDTLQDQLDELLNELCHLHHSGELSNEHYDHLHDQVDKHRAQRKEMAQEQKKTNATRRQEQTMLHQLKMDGQVTLA